MTKREEYLDYINEHISNVEMVWKKYKHTITLDINTISRLDYLIGNHDDSKFGELEFEAYRNNFFPEHNEEKSKKHFQEAWNHHQKFNHHHWQYWIMWKPEGSVVLEMDYYYILEMLCDWTAMSLKFNQKSVSEWYKKEKANMLLGIRTRQLIEDILFEFDDVLTSLTKLLREAESGC